MSDHDMKEEQHRRKLSLSSKNNMKVSFYFKVHQASYKGKDKQTKTKSIFKSTNSHLVPAGTSYVLYHEDKEVFAGKYKRARCAKRLLRTGQDGAAANCPAALYLPKNDFSLFQLNPDVKHTCVGGGEGSNYHEDISARMGENARLEESMMRERARRKANEETKEHIQAYQDSEEHPASSFL